MSSEWAALADRYGIPGALIALFFYGLIIRKWWVLGRELQREEEARKRAEQGEAHWMQLALNGTELADTSMQLLAMEQGRQT